MNSPPCSHCPKLQGEIAQLRIQLGNEKDRVEQRDLAIIEFLKVQDELLEASVEEGEAIQDVKVPAHWKDVYDVLRALVKNHPKRNA